ncbi:MAG: DnaJ domain-containing protein, partial [Candidatus Omnitrophota bacterium]
MSTQKSRFRLWLKATALAVVCLFTLNNLVWANPDLFSTNTNVFNLGVPNASSTQWFFSPSRIKTAATLVANGITAPIQEIDICVPVILHEDKKTKITKTGSLDFEHKREENGLWVVPFDIYNGQELEQELEAVFTDNKKLVELREKGAKKEMPSVQTADEYKKLLGADYVEYDMTVKKIVNPDDKPLRAIYGGAGADISHFLLSTNAREAYFVAGDKNLQKLSGTGYEFTADNLLEMMLNAKLTPSIYLEGKKQKGYVASPFVVSNGQVASAISFELQAILGVNLDDINIDSNEGHPRISFKWTYPGTQKEETYSITFINADITAQNEYSPFLKKVIAGGVDIYYQKAGVGIPEHYRDEDSFISHIVDNLNEGGFTVTDDHAYESEKLEERGLLFKYVDRSSDFPTDQLTEIPIEDIESIKESILEKRKACAVYRDNRIEVRYGWDLRIRKKAPQVKDGHGRDAEINLNPTKKLPPRSTYDLPREIFGGDGSNLIDLWQEALRSIGLDNSVIAVAGSAEYLARNGILPWNAIRDIDLKIYLPQDTPSSVLQQHANIREAFLRVASSHNYPVQAPGSIFQTVSDVTLGDKNIELTVCKLGEQPTSSHVLFAFFSNCYGNKETMRHMRSAFKETDPDRVAYHYHWYYNTEFHRYRESGPNTGSIEDYLKTLKVLIRLTRLIGAHDVEKELTDTLLDFFERKRTLSHQSDEYRDFVREVMDAHQKFVNLLNPGKIGYDRMNEKISAVVEKIRHDLQGDPKCFNIGRSPGERISYQDLEFLEEYDGVYFGSDTRYDENTLSDEFMPYRLFKFTIERGESAYLVRETLARALGRFRNAAMASMNSVGFGPEDDRNDEVAELVNALFNDIKRHRGLLVRLARNLPWDSALFEIGGANVLVFSEEFFKDAMLGYYFPHGYIETPPGWDNGEACTSLWPLCERLNHELSHSGKFKDDRNEELKEEARCVYRDYLFLKFILRSRNNRKLKDKVDLYMKNLKNRYGSNEYFKFLNGLVGSKKTKVKSRIWAYVKRHYSHQKFGIKAFPSRHPRKNRTEFDLKHVVRCVVDIFDKEPERKILPTQLKIAEASGLSDATISKYFGSILERLHEKAGEFDEEKAKRVRIAIAFYRERPQTIAEYIIGMFKNDPGRKKLPMQVKIAKAFGVRDGIIQRCFPRVLVALEEMISGSDEEWAKRLKRAVSFQKDRVGAIARYIIELFEAEPKRKNLPGQKKIAKAFGFASKAISKHFKAVLERLKAEEDGRVKKAAERYMRFKRTFTKDFGDIVISRAAQHIIKLFTEDPKREKLPTHKELAEAIDISKYTLPKYFRAILEGLRNVSDVRIKRAVELILHPELRPKPAPKPRSKPKTKRALRPKPAPKPKSQKKPKPAPASKAEPRQIKERVSAIMQHIRSLRRNPYQLLGIPSDATEEEIRTRFRKLAVQYHPDKNVSGKDGVAMKELSSAYEILMNPEKRKICDGLLKAKFSRSYIERCIKKLDALPADKVASDGSRTTRTIVLDKVEIAQLLECDPDQLSLLVQKINKHLSEDGLNPFRISPKLQLDAPPAGPEDGGTSYAGLLLMVPGSGPEILGYVLLGVLAYIYLCSQKKAIIDWLHTKGHWGLVLEKIANALLLDLSKKSKLKMKGGKDLDIVWTGKRKKEGLRIACVQIELPSLENFENATQRMAKIVRRLRGTLGKNAPDLVVFPEEAGDCTEAQAEQRMKSLEKAARDAQTSIGYCVDSQADTYYYFIQPGGEKSKITRYKKEWSYGEEDRILSINTPDGNYKIFTLICAESGPVLSIEGNKEKFLKDVREANLVFIPSYIQPGYPSFTASMFFHNFHRPTIVLNEGGQRRGGSFFSSEKVSGPLIEDESILMVDIVDPDSRYGPSLKELVLSGSISYEELRETLFEVMQNLARRHETG